MSEQATTTKLTAYVTEYSEQTWPGFPVPVPTAKDLERMAVRADGYANAHVQGGCTCGWTAEECGDRTAAAEFVEVHG